jgi:hypothetical protein
MGLHSGQSFRDITRCAIKQFLALGSTRDRIKIKLMVALRSWPHLTRIAGFLNLVATHDRSPAHSSSDNETGGLTVQTAAGHEAMPSSL